jgi:hypothetical protein
MGRCGTRFRGLLVLLVECWSWLPAARYWIIGDQSKLG